MGIFSLIGRIFTSKANILSMGSADMITFQNDAFTAKVVYRTAKALEQIVEDLEKLNKSFNKKITLSEQFKFTDVVINTYNQIRNSLDEEEKALYNILRLQNILHMHEVENLQKLREKLERRLNIPGNTDDQKKQLKLLINEIDGITSGEQKRLESLRVKEGTLAVNVKGLGSFVSMHDNMDLSNIIKKASKREFKYERRERDEFNELLSNSKELEQKDPKKFKSVEKEFEQKLKKFIQDDDSKDFMQKLSEDDCLVLIARMEEVFNMLNTKLTELKDNNFPVENLQQIKTWTDRLRLNLHDALVKLSKMSSLAKSQ